MWFHLDVNELSRNPRVYKVDERRIVLKTDFRIELYKMWRNGDKGFAKRIRQIYMLMAVALVSYP
ncbi:MAG: hypothetical protein K6E53_15215 [Lachnospiraceae bacterium]|nr:hypothetical protein [Lachnospiraceae bacterium]